MHFQIRYYMDLSGGLHAQVPVRLKGRGCDVYWVRGWVSIIPDWGKNCFPVQFWGQPKRLFGTRFSFPRVAAVDCQNRLIIHTKLPGNTHSLPPYFFLSRFLIQHRPNRMVFTIILRVTDNLSFG